MEIIDFSENQFKDELIVPIVIQDLFENYYFNLREIYKKCLLSKTDSISCDLILLELAIKNCTRIAPLLLRKETILRENKKSRLLALELPKSLKRYYQMNEQDEDILLIKKENNPKWGDCVIVVLNDCIMHHWYYHTRTGLYQLRSE